MLGRLVLLNANLNSLGTGHLYVSPTIRELGRLD